MNKINWDEIERWTLALFAFSLSISIAAENIILGTGLLLVLRRLAQSPEARRRLLIGVSIPLLLYLMIDVSAALFSGFPVHIKSWLEDKWVISAYVFILTLTDSEKKLRTTALALVAGGSVMALYAIIQFFVGWDFLRQQPLEAISGFGYMAVGVFSHHLTYGGLALITFIFAFTGAILWWREREGSRWLGATVITGLGLLFSYARSALVGLAAGVGVLTLLLDKRIRMPLIIGVAAAGLLAILFVPGMSERFLNSFSGGQHNEGPRIRLWLTAVEIIKHHPWLGMGQGNFDEGFERYHLPGVYDNHAHAHNDFLSVAVDGGLFALAAFLFIWVKFFHDLSKAWKGGITDSRMRWILQAGAVSVASILLAGMFQNYQSDAEVGAMVWTVVGLTQASALLTRKPQDG